MIANVLNAQPLPVYCERYDLLIDPAKIQRELGRLPEISFEQGINKTISWYLGNRSGTMIV